MRQLKNYKQSAAPEQVSDAASKYSGMNENELKQELFKQVSESKNNGTFSAREIDDFVSFVSPELDEKSRQRLNELVKMIKGG